MILSEVEFNKLNTVDILCSKHSKSEKVIMKKCSLYPPRKMLADILPLHPESHVFSSAEGGQYGQVTGIKKVKPSIRTVFFFP